MRTFVLWTHYDCEVYATLHSSRLDAFMYLKNGWLDDGCDPEEYGCDHESLDTIEEIRDALEYHYEDMSYDINEMEVPLTTAEQSMENARQLLPEPAPITILDEQAGDLMSRLETFSRE